MKFGSICSGIEAASVAWHPLGWRASFLSEIEAFPRAVLAHHYPTVSLHGDFTTIQAGDYEPIDLLVGGTPCQSFSIAGLRGGLGDDRGNLALEYLRLADRLRPRWLVWENVPGVFSSLSHAAPDPVPPTPPLDLGCEGAELETEDEYSSEELHSFYCFLAGLSELGYGWAYRVLDAQHFGVPQRRRRVFVVGYIGDWCRAAAVLFERESLRGDPAPRREARKDVAPTISARPTGGDGLGTDFDLDGGLVAGTLGQRTCDHPNGMKSESDFLVAFGCNNTYGPINVAGALNASHTASGRQDFESETFITGTLLANGKAAGSATSQDAENGFLITHALRGEGFDAGEDGTGRGTPIVPTMMSNGDAHSGFKDHHGLVSAHSAVRRLTPTECERLQGFPDGYTNVPYRNKPAADGPRYKALGNSMAVPCMHWIGERIQMVEKISQGIN